jgi:outer membrane protein TolC
MRRLTFVLATLIATSALAEANFPLIQSSAPLSLDSLVALGIQNNPQIRQAGFNVDLNRIGKLAALGNFLPQVSLGASFSESHFENSTFINSDGSVSTYPITIIDSYLTLENGEPVLRTDTLTLNIPEGKTRSSSYNVTASLSLFEGGGRYFLWRFAKDQATINELTLLDAQKTLTRNIAQQVVGVLSTEKLLALNIKLRDQRQDAFDLAKARYDVGAVTELDVMRAEIELGTAENSIRSTERDLQTQREGLYQLLGIDLGSHFPIAEANDITPYQFDLDALLKTAHQNRTDMNIAALQVRQAKNNLGIARTSYLPSIVIGATRSRSEQSGAGESYTLDPRNKNTSYWLSANWNLFDGFAREYNVASRKVMRNQAIESERNLLLGIDKSVRDAFSNLETVFEQMQTTERNRDLAERTLNLERERYRLGAASALALRDAHVTYAMAETDNLSKQLEYQSTMIALELAVGKSLR